MKYLWCVWMALVLMSVSERTDAQSSPTVRVPLCLIYPDANRYVPCTGVVNVDPTTGNPLNNHSTEIDNSITVGTSSVILFPANPNRQGFEIQIQSNVATCYWSSLGAATADLHSLQIGPGTYYVSNQGHVSVSDISIICTMANTQVHALQW